MKTKQTETLRDIPQETMLELWARWDREDRERIASIRQDEWRSWTIAQLFAQREDR